MGHHLDDLLPRVDDEDQLGSLDVDQSRAGAPLQEEVEVQAVIGLPV